jgi:sulfinoalanine decarboxylase / aspartate 1-decarboxylase
MTNRQLVGQVLKHSNLDNHPRYFTELYGGYDLFALAGSWVADAINATPWVFQKRLTVERRSSSLKTCRVTYEAAPIFTMTDVYVISKFLSFFGWEKTGDGVFTPGGSMANMYALIYARNLVYPDINQTGMSGKRPLVLFTSEDVSG